MFDTLSIERQSKPFGSYGDITINQITNKLTELNWEGVYGNIKTTVHLAPTAINLISYGLLVKTYLKLVYNKPAPSHLTRDKLASFNIVKHNRFVLFSTIWAPVLVLGIRS